MAALSSTQVRRGISFVADVLFVVGIVWLLCLAIAALLGGSQAAAEHAGPLMFGLVFVLPAPMLFCLDALCRRGPPRHQAQGVEPWPAARQPRTATLVARNPSPPSSPGSDDPEFMAPPYEWRDERLPTYEEAIRAPKVEVLAPRLHHETPAAVFYKASRLKVLTEDANRHLRHTSQTPSPVCWNMRSGSDLYSSPRETVNRKYQVRRGISFVADVLFVVGIVWLLCLAIAALLGGSQMAAEHAGTLMFGLVFVLPAPMLFCLDALCRRGPPRNQAQPVSHGRPTLGARNPSPPSSPGSDDPAFMLPPYEWRDERLPTYEEAIRAPKVEVLAPRPAP
ncbi:hypothetical protein HPB48_023340 [Haemaphysalis longicornis]|uniref:Uncharacterized protein n=1 Tax=Haemaphysalis longicornis TaxID=44386 RepID=A0A9J6H6X4_HAELO|nr:hypothetical protein HPB48_023340 [Haemaphysalis longicornis]